MARPWFPFYFADYAAKTEHLTLTEHGAYLLLMGSYYKTGCKLPANAKQLQRICRAFEPAEVEAMQSILDQFFELDGDHYTHTRIDEELQKSNEISNKRSKAAQKRYKNDANAPAKDTANAPANAEQLHTQSQSQSQPHTQLHLQPQKIISSEPSGTEPEPDKSPIVIFLTLNTGEEYPVTQALVDEYSKLYPAVDVMKAFRDMRGWCISNKNKRKTKNGILRFVNTWLSKEQDSGGFQRGNQQQESRAKQHHDKLAEIAERSIKTAS